jgi:transposase-like protein
MRQRGRERDRGKERYWRRVLRHWQRSGQGVRAFCSAYGLSEPLFYAWRRTIQQRDRQAESPSRRGPRQARSAVADDGLPTFVPVTITAAAATLEVVLGDGRVVRVPSGFDAAALRQLLRVLAEAPPC